jgi:membrane fusion protein, multidrug efflux system
MDLSRAKSGHRKNNYLTTEVSMGFSEIWRPVVSKAGFLALLLVLGLVGCGQEPVLENARERPLPVVAVQDVVMTDVDVFRSYPARVHGSRQVQVRARVQGILEKKLYQEGSVVEKNDILFIIDPKSFEIALRRAEAELRDSRATRDHAQREKQRYSRLYDQNAVSQRERDQALTNYDLAEARVSMAEAALEDAKLNLGYTEVRSPVAGITGMEDVSEGNLIDWGGLLTTISQNDPVHVLFSMPENDALVRRAIRPSDTGSAGSSSFEAGLFFSSGERYPEKGIVDFTSSTIDPATGTVTARAVFPNPELLLLPGQFLRIEVLLQSLEGVIIIPEQAVSQGPEGPRVFVVDEGVAGSRNVILGPVTEKGQVVHEGLAPGDLVVVNGHVALRPGVPVRIKDHHTGDDS